MNKSVGEITFIIDSDLIKESDTKFYTIYVGVQYHFSVENREPEIVYFYLFTISHSLQEYSI